jgi:hypothetical protein
MAMKQSKPARLNTGPMADLAIRVHPALKCDTKVHVMVRAIVVALIVTATPGFAATIVCKGGYDIIDCGGGKTVTCHDFDGNQVDCVNEPANLQTICDNAGIVQEPVVLAYTSLVTCIACPSNHIITCEHGIPTRGFCTAPADTTHLVDCHPASGADAACRAAATTAVGGSNRPSRLLAFSFPNPQRTFSTFAFALPHQGYVSIQILDSQGRAVRTLLNAPFPAGLWSIDWNGRNDGGESVPQGLYFYRVRLGEGQVLGKTMVIR